MEAIASRDISPYITHINEKSYKYTAREMRDICQYLRSKDFFVWEIARLLKISEVDVVRYCGLERN